MFNLDSFHISFCENAKTVCENAKTVIKRSPSILP